MRDSESFDAFYTSSVRRITGQVYAMIGSRAEAEDCVQEAYARAWQRWRKVSGYDDPEAWVRVVAYRIGGRRLAADVSPLRRVPQARTRR